MDNKSLPMLIVTGQVLLDRALEVAGFKPLHLKRALKRTNDALDADEPTRIIRQKDGSTEEIEGGPDHDIRLRAADQIYGLAGFKARREVPADPERSPVINVLIVNSETAGQSAQEDRRSIRVVSSEGNGAGDPVPGGAGRREDLGGPVGDGDARD